MKNCSLVLERQANSRLKSVNDALTLWRLFAKAGEKYCSREESFQFVRYEASQLPADHPETP